MHEFTRVETNVNQKLKFSSTRVRTRAGSAGMRGPGRASPRPRHCHDSRSARPPVSTSLSTLKLCATHCASPRSSSPSHDPRRLVGGRCCECTRAHHGARCCESTRPPWRPMLRKHGPTMAPAHARSRLRPGLKASGARRCRWRLPPWRLPQWRLPLV